MNRSTLDSAERPLVWRALFGTVASSAVAIGFVVWLRAAVLGPTGFPSHAACWRNTASLLWLHGASDAVIWLAYTAIPILILHVMALCKARMTRLPVLLFWLAGFIWLCGTSHALDFLETWLPIQWSRGGFKAATAIASVGFTVRLYRDRFAIASMVRAAMRAVEVERAFDEEAATPPQELEQLP